MVRRTADTSASPDFLLKLVALANFMPFLTERRTRGIVLCDVAGNPGSLPMNKWGFWSSCLLAGRTAGPSSPLRSGRDDNSFAVLAFPIVNLAWVISTSTCRRQVRLLGMTIHLLPSHSPHIKKTADSSASLGMTKGRVALSVGVMVPIARGCCSLLSQLAAGKSGCSR
jgi:hypothetical protein